ncbi:MAG TPA: peptidoglycan DD-metalloendopeptidase family protein [Verrucomicrobiae bacterium]|nr:peptidoglycan DD-metalloendopeptidase family protein [Verrucomicrobiae bacterium]
MKYFYLRIKQCLLAVACAALVAPSLQSIAFAQSTSDFYTETNNVWYDKSSSVCGPGSGGGPGAESIANVPEPWRSLIAKHIPDFPKVDPRLVAATLWVENREWPPYDKDWGVSHAGAAGPWQFIVPTWQSMMPGYTLADRNNPEIAVIAAFKHQEGSAGLPILPGYTGDPQTAYSSLPFYRSMAPDKASLMYFMAKYNGSGAPDGQTLNTFPRNENSDYVKMGFWLIASDFKQAYLAEGNRFVDPLNPRNEAGGPNGGASNLSCGDGGNVNAEGYAFPVGGIPKEDISNGYRWPCSSICHHDGTPAFDLFHKDSPGGNAGATVGKPVIAIYKGKIENLSVYRGHQGCYIFQLIGEDNAQYWYIHVQNVTIKEGDTVQAGQKIAEIGEPRCTDKGDGSLPHLHIDQSPDGRESTRDKRLVPLIDKLYEELKSNEVRV